LIDEFNPAVVAAKAKSVALHLVAVAAAKYEQGKH
jgi:hypothetical protein